MTTRRTAALLLLVMALAAAALAVATLWPPGADPDDRAIAFERKRRTALWLAGQPLPGQLSNVEPLAARLEAHGVALGAPVLIRIFKLEHELELWMLRDGRFHRFAVYPICRFSGRLGPKLAEGDRQAPEGIYTFDTTALNPASRWHRSFNLGFPNAYDRAHGRTGSFLMVHGGCSSIGCFAMTDPGIDEIWTIVTAALKRGQPRIHVHVFPFHPTVERLGQRSASPWIELWRDLAAVYETFEGSRLEPRVAVCRGRYVVRSGDERQAAGSAVLASCAATAARSPRGKRREASGTAAGSTQASR